MSECPTESHAEGGNAAALSLDALRAQRSYLRQVLDINPTLIFAKDRGGRFTLVNKAVADIYGTNVEDLIGKTDADFNLNKEEVAFFRRIDLQVMDSQKEVLIPEEAITDAKGEVHWLQTVKRPIIGPDGVANQILGVATDITRRRELEAQLRQAQKMEALGQLAGGIAHDFNNMLAVVLGNADRLLRKLPAEPPNASTRDALEMIASAGERAAVLVRQLLAFSRKQPASAVVLDLNAVLADLEGLLRRLIGEHVDLTVKFGTGLLCVRADPGHLEQIIVNLAVNARDAMPEGGKLRIETAIVDVGEDQTAQVPEARPGCHVRLSVSDTGIGMPSEIVARIFEPFFTTKPVGKGTGLGLSIVYGIVKQTGGHVAATSRPGAGSTFRVYLPLLDDTLAKSVQRLDGDKLCGTETILVCEDEPDVLRLAQGILEDHGYHVLAAIRGSQAMELAAGHAGTIHLLATDVVMPEMNGRQLAEAMRATRPEIKVLYMTGYSADVLAPLAGEGDLRELLSKPFNANALLRRVRAILEA